MLKKTLIPLALAAALASSTAATLPTFAAPVDVADVQVQKKTRMVKLKSIECVETQDYRKDEIIIKKGNKTIWGPVKMWDGDAYAINARYKLPKSGLNFRVIDKDLIGHDDQIGSFHIRGNKKKGSDYVATLRGPDDGVYEVYYSVYDAS